MRIHVWKKLLQFVSSLRAKEPVMTDILCERFQVTLDRKIKGYSKGMKQKIGMVHYFDPGKNLILHKTEWSHLTVLLAVAVIFLAAAVVWLNKRDIAVT